MRHAGCPVQISKSLVCEISIFLFLILALFIADFHLDAANTGSMFSVVFVAKEIVGPQ